LEWLGRVVRMDGEKTVKKLLEMKTRRGKREKKWETWIKVGWVL
jgi:hypothetical protein